MESQVEGHPITGYGSRSAGSSPLTIGGIFHLHFSYVVDYFHYAHGLFHCQADIQCSARLKWASMTPSACYKALCPVLPGHGPAPHAPIMGTSILKALLQHRWNVVMRYSCLLFSTFLGHLPLLPTSDSHYTTLPTLSTLTNTVKQASRGWWLHPPA